MFRPFGETVASETLESPRANAAVSVTACGHAVPFSFTASTKCFVAAAAASFFRSHRLQSLFSAADAAGVALFVACPSARFQVDEPAPSLNIFTGISSVSPSSLYGWSVADMPCSTKAIVMRPSRTLYVPLSVSSSSALTARTESVPLSRTSVTVAPAFGRVPSESWTTTYVPLMSASDAGVLVADGLDLPPPQAVTTTARTETARSRRSGEQRRAVKNMEPAPLYE